MNTTQAETDAAKTLPEGCSLEEIYNPIRENIAKVVKPVQPASELSIPSLATTAATVTPATSVAEALDQSADNDAAAAAVLGAMIDSDAARVCDVRVGGPAAPKPTVEGGNYYAFLDGGGEEGEEIEEGGAGEKLLYGEIEKFRMRQIQRDK